MPVLVRDPPRPDTSPVVVAPLFRQPDPTREPPPAEQLWHRARTFADPGSHRRCPAAVAFRERLGEVLPRDQPRRPPDRRLVALRERDRLPLVVRTVVAEEQVQPIHREERAARGPGLEARGPLVRDVVAAEPTEGAGIGLVLVRTHHESL